jgi:YD repeat-containing protein
VETLKPFATHVPTLAGTSLAEVAAMARAVGLSLVPAYRETAETLPVPAVIHWKLGHYSALLEQDGERYRIEDPALGGSRWMTRSTLLEEISGYALLPEGSTAGWAPVPEVQAGAVIGHSCPPGGPGSTGPPPQEPPPCNGMAVYDFHPVLASLRLSDIPVGYQPARGPSAEFRLTYNQREGFTPQIPTFSHVGPRWTFNWLSYVKEEPQVCGDSCQPAHVWVYLPGGWRDTFSLPDAQGVYPVNKRTGSVLVRTSTSPLAFERRLSDGSIEIFGLSDGAAANQRRVFLTERRDPRGAAMTFTYDAQFRLVAAVDALGQVSTLDYEDPTDPLKITKVTDPFGRSATLTYNAAGQLASITDVLGLTSSLAYGPEDFVAMLTTPHGTTTFRHETNHGDFFSRYIEATDPLGATERLAYAYETPGLASAEAAADVPTGFDAWNVMLEKFNTLSWDKRAWQTGPGSLATATITHWLYEEEVPGQTAYAIPVPHSVKRPLERRIWYAYPGQSANSTGYAGNQWQPSRVARVLDDGTSQITTTTYTSRGLVASRIDPVGRETVFLYDSNGLDLVETRQTNGTSDDVLETRTYKQPAPAADGHRCRGGDDHLHPSGP